VIVAVGRLAQELGDNLESLEVNPLRVAGHEVEALDALVVWRPRPDRAAAVRPG
jgi:acetate---CoA ligase (ADP-forming)